MKKLMKIGLAAAAILTLAGQAKAAPLETSGELRARGWYVDNYVVNTKSTEWWDQRLRLNMVWPVAEGVKVNVRADILEGQWGTGVKTAEEPFNKEQISFDWVNMQFVVPNTPMTVMMGRMDSSFGTGLLLSKDYVDRLKATWKFAPELAVTLGYTKATEIFGAHGTGNLDDARNWFGIAAGSAAGVNYGFTAIYAVNDSVPTKSTSTMTFDGFVMGKAAMVDLKAEVAYATGKTEISGKSDIDLSGLAAYVSAAMPAGPVTVTLEGAYASGDDPSTPNKNEGAVRFDYNSSFWSIILYNNLDMPGYLGSASGNAVTSDYLSDYGVTNAIAGKASVAMSPMKGLTLIFAGVYATTAQDVVVTVKPAVAAVAKTATTAAVAASPAVTKTYSGSMGTELDAVVVYNITDNVYFLGGIGYLFAGNVFGDVKDPLGTMVSLNVKF